MLKNIQWLPIVHWTKSKSLTWHPRLLAHFHTQLSKLMSTFSPTLMPSGLQPGSPARPCNIPWVRLPSALGPVLDLPLPQHPVWPRPTAFLLKVTSGLPATFY